MESQIQAVLFDMDGVLVDSFEVLYHALNDTWKEFYGRKMNKDEFEKDHWGSKLENTVFERWGDKGKDYFFSRIDEHFHRSRLLSGVKEVIGSIPQKCGVVTNGPEDYTESFLIHFDLKKYFDVIISSDDVNKNKPDPEPVFRACEVLGVDPGNVVFVGDTDKDVSAGRAAGVVVVGIGIQGDYRIESMEELPAVLSKIEKS
ncbi:MAG: HAD family hydrolase [Candidatus Hadarchaeia archaeon]